MEMITTVWHTLKLLGPLQFARALLLLRRSKDSPFDERLFSVDFALRRASETFGLPPGWRYSEADLGARARGLLAARQGQSWRDAWEDLLFLIEYEHDPENLRMLEEARKVQKSQPPLQVYNE
jgi:hypothetical protein